MKMIAVAKSANQMSIVMLMSLLQEFQAAEPEAFSVPWYTSVKLLLTETSVQDFAESYSRA
jgi:hypothetical protein